MGATSHLLHFYVRNRNRSQLRLQIRQLFERVSHILDWIVLSCSKLQIARKQRVQMPVQSSIFQSISVIGYCMLPLTLLGFIVSLISGKAPAVVKLILVLIGFAWSSVACVIVMRDLVSQSKKYLCSYPILLFYIFLGWYAIVA